MPHEANLPNPRPPHGSLEAEFWSHAWRGDLRFQQCTVCDRWRHPPSSVCPGCQAESYRWSAAPGEARLFSWTTVHHAMHPQVKTPYTVVLVDFPDAGIRFASNLERADTETLHLGMPLRLAWRAGPTGSIPVFATDLTP